VLHLALNGSRQDFMGNCQGQKILDLAPTRPINCDLLISLLLVYFLGFEVVSFEKQFVLNSMNLFSILQDISPLMDFLDWNLKRLKITSLIGKQNRC
jgi:hypothetical protein